MQLNPGMIAHGFSVTSNEPLEEIGGQAITAVHEQSGAKLLYLKNDDNNKAFAIGFRTPPQDDTGVFHILEHSVLCGSRRFPVKEPFVDLLKGSMQTFLNAMTFPDKTLYPVASTNEQDLYNLMDVYLDAVFHPRIYEKRAIFEQEGWHYELVAPEGGDAAALPADQTELVYNGVVFNEMKGALSDATSVLYDELQKALLPDTPYAFESGGTPKAIPSLTYEDYLDEHRRHYRTDNSYIVLYGNLDIDKALAFLDERYLVPVHAEQLAVDEERAAQGLEPLAPRTIPLQKPVSAGYLSRTMDTTPENACAASGYVIGNASDRTRVMAADVLLDALFGSNEAPLKRALLDAGVAHDVNAFVADSLQQPFAVVQVHMPAEGTGRNLSDLVCRSVRELLDGGLDQELVEAALSHAEFEMREHELGMADGVANAIIALTGWLYDDGAALDYLRYEDAFAELRASISDGYFERLCAELFLENDHTATVEIVPTPGESDDDSPQRLAAMNAGLSADERAHIVAEEAVLREMQEAPDTPEAIATLPRLSVSDIGQSPEDPACELDETKPVACLRSRVDTHGISYANRYFDMSVLAFEEFPYAEVLALVLGKLDTAKHTAAEIDTLVQGKLGNLTFSIDAYEDFGDVEVLLPKFIVSSSSLAGNVEWLAALPREILLETDFSDKGKILDVLKQRKIGSEQMFMTAGHSCASSRVRSYYAPLGVLREQFGNVGFYRFLCDLIEHFDERSDELVRRLEDLANRLFRDGDCLIGYAGNDDSYARFWEAGPECGRDGDAEKRLVVPEPCKLNEAFITPSDVCFAAMGYDRRLLGEDYTGTWLVVARALSYDYLWNEVRVKGGAYGVGFQTSKMGNMSFYSYRDPHLDETFDRFIQASEWLSAFDPSREDLEGFIVATVAQIDKPIKPRAFLRRQVQYHFIKVTPEDRAAIRAQIVATEAAAVRELAPTVGRMVDERAMCAFGNREILEASKAGLDVIELVK